MIIIIIMQTYADMLTSTWSSRSRTKLSRSRIKLSRSRTKLSRSRTRTERKRKGQGLDPQRQK